MAVLVAFIAAFGFAVASVGQQYVATRVPNEHALKVGLLMRLGTNWRWLAATSVDVAAFVCEAIALSLGSLVSVQAVLPASLLFALPLSAALLGKRLSRTEWIGAFGVAGGIVVFLVAAWPGAGRSQAPARVWLALLVIIATMVVILVATGVRSTAPSIRAGCWAAAGAMTYAFMAAVTKSTVDIFGDGFGVVVTSWQPYAVVLSAALGTLLIQSAFQAGSLGASMPLMVMVEPISGVLIGSIVFREQLNHDPLQVVAMVVALAAMVAGVMTLSRSPLARYLA